MRTSRSASLRAPAGLLLALLAASPAVAQERSAPRSVTVLDDDLTALQAAFAAAHGHVRLVVLVSPT